MVKGKQVKGKQVQGKQIATVGLIAALLGVPLIAGSVMMPGQAQTQADRKTEALRLNNLGRQLYRQGRYQEALAQYNQALMIVREIQARQGEGAILNNIGATYYSLGRYSDALKVYEQALAINQELDDRTWEANTLNSMGEVYRSLSQYPTALRYYERALALRRQINDRAGEGTTLNNLGAVRQNLGQYSTALQRYEQALAIHREVGNRFGESITLNNMGLVYQKLGQYSAALQRYEQTLAINRELNDRVGVSTTLNNIGLVYHTLGQYSAALERYEQALVVSQEIGDRASESATLNNIGGVYNLLGQYPAALEQYQKALAIRQEIGDRAGEGNILHNIAGVYNRLGEPTIALERYQQALAIRREVGDRAGEGTTLNNIGGIFNDIGQYPIALGYYKQSLAIHREVGDRPSEGTVLNNIGFTYLTAGDEAAAEAPLRQAIQIWESLRPGLSDTNKVALFELQKDTYGFLQQSLIAQNKILEALEIAERGRARAFVELLANQLAEGAVPTVRPLTTEEIKQVARDQQATLVQYSIISNEFLYIWVVTPTGEITFRSVNLDTAGLTLSNAVNQGRDDVTRSPNASTKLAQLVNRSRTAIAATQPTTRSFFNPDRGNQVARNLSFPREEYPDLQKLHQLLIDPIQDLLPEDENARVIFLPHQSLFLVPFVALQDESRKFLIEKHTILTAPSIQVLQLTRKAAVRNAALQPEDILIVGNPTMPEGWSSLPGAGQEAKALAEFFEVPFLTGDQATEQAVLQQIATARIIHLATHGKADDEEPMESLLAFAPAGKDDGYLKAGELFAQFGTGQKQSLQAELVVLSACQTGLGKLSGDGVLGLSRTFFAMGAPTVVVSLWNVSDTSTNDLMQLFYRNWQEQGMDKAQAMRQAMLSLLNGDYPEPVYWSAFMVMGEAESGKVKDQ